MAGNICDVCSKESVGVAASPLGAYSNAYCKDCIETEIEPYWDLVSFGFCVSTNLEDLHSGYKDIITESLEFHGKTIEEWKADVEKFERDFIDQMTQESKSKDFEDEDPFEVEF